MCYSEDIHLKNVKFYIDLVLCGTWLTTVACVHFFPATSPTFTGSTSRPWQSLHTQACFWKGCQCTCQRGCVTVIAPWAWGCVLCSRPHFTGPYHSRAIHGHTCEARAKWVLGAKRLWVLLPAWVRPSSEAEGKPPCFFYLLQFFWQSFLKEIFSFYQRVHLQSFWHGYLKNTERFQVSLNSSKIIF